MLARVISRSKFTLPSLKYSYDALEPVVSEKIMELHHSKHHQAYVDNLNANWSALEGTLQSTGDGALDNAAMSGVLKAQQAIKFNGGGYLNHCLFFDNLAPTSEGGGDGPSGELEKLIAKQWGDVDAFKTAFNGSAAAVQGSGWGWLGYNKATQTLAIATTANQDPLEGLTPLLGVDVWEHAYYLDYNNRRPEYLTNIWKVINWREAEKRLAEA